MSTGVESLASPQEGASATKTQHDKPSGNETFHSFVMNNIKELNEKANLKYDLSKNLTALVMMCREIKSEELKSRTSESFRKSITGGKDESKVYEYFVYVPNISDYQVLPTVEEMEVFYKLRHASRELKELESQTGKKTKSSSLEAITAALPTDADRQRIIDKILTKIESLYRFYGAEDKTGSNMVNCKVKFHDVNNLQYGKFISAGTLATTKAAPPFKETLKKVKNMYQGRSDFVAKQAASKLKATVPAPAELMIERHVTVDRMLKNLEYARALDEAMGAE
tara:strand:+ start:579 stop:1424 length:846 start_codon:yes stop_codon:yes gene_type:complete